MHETLPVILILLTSAVLAVALFRALKLPAMLAYFLVGILLGPKTFGLMPDNEANRELAEFGIVFLMFSIGLEFSISQLYAMRRIVLGIGGLQVIITMGLIMLLCASLGLGWQIALVVAVNGVPVSQVQRGPVAQVVETVGNVVSNTVRAVGSTVAGISSRRGLS